MTEVDIGGANPVTYPELATWQWEVALYLFLGGLVAGLMIMGAVFKLMRSERFNRSLMIADVSGLPLLGAGMLFLWADLANRWNAWQFFASFQVTSPMSWGSWILLLSMFVLALRLLSHLPMPNHSSALETPLTRKWGLGSQVRAAALAAALGVWRRLAAVGQRVARSRYALDVATLVLGVGLGFYTGILLSSIAARPLWNSSVLAPLFLVSGLASAGAFICLFVPKEEHKRLVPYSVLFCGTELLLIAAYVITLVMGGEASQRAGSLIFGGDFTLLFWGIVVLIGLLLPVLAEGFELAGRHIPALLSRVPPVLKLAGSMGLRMVIVYAGLRSFM